MPHTRQSNSPLAIRWERVIFKPAPSRLARIFGPYLLVMAFATAAQAQMDFSGAQTLMGTFKTFAIYAALFYRTLNGSQVGDLFMSLIHTCQLCTVNSLHNLIELQRHAQNLAARPAEWMPWSYRETLARVAE
jgi:hypothetical protein